MWRISILIIVALAITIPVHAKPQKAHKNKTSPKYSQEQVGIERKGNFSPAERNLIRAQLQRQDREVSQKKHKNLPPGLQKKVARGKELPPGWQKKVAPGHSLDYQVYRQGENLPDILLRRLPPPPIGSEILRIENKIIRLHAATRTILDVFELTPRR